MQPKEKSRLSLTQDQVVEFYKSMGLGTIEERDELLKNVFFCSDDPQKNEVSLPNISYYLNTISN